MNTAPRYAPFVHVFVPFAILLTLGNLYAETSPNLIFGRVVASILLCGVISLPAVILFFRHDLTTAPPLIGRYWQLFWIFGFLSYALHFQLAVGGWFEWDFAQIWRRQTGLVTITNCSLLISWGIDATFALFGPSAGGKPVRILRWITHLLFVVAFVVASVVFRSETRTLMSLALGSLLIVTSLGSLVLRWWK